MQIQPPATGAQAASLAAQTGAKDATGGAPEGSAARIADNHVEQSNESHPDRDAQGQGDGLADPEAGDENEVGREERDAAADAKLLPPGADHPEEPPSQLDIVG